MKAITIGLVAAVSQANILGDDAHYFLRSTFQTQELFDYNLYCQHTVDDYVFDFKALQQEQEDYVVKSGTTEFTFNFCKKLTNPCKVDAYAALKSDGCQPLSGSNSQNDRVASIVNQNSNDANDIHLSLQYTGAECPTDKTKQATFTLEVMCDPSIKDEDLTWTVVNSSPCAAVLSTSTASGCQAFSFAQAYSFLTKYTQVWGGVFIILGLILTFTGRIVFKPAICLAGTLAVTVLVLFFSYEVILSSSPPEWAGWVTLAVAVVLGLGVGFLLAKVAKVGVALLAAWGGVSLGFICYSAFLYKIHSSAVFWVVIVAFALIFAGLTFCIFDPILITATSLFGSYLLIRGTSFYAGGYPSEYSLYNDVDDGDYNKIPTTFYYYMGAFFVLLLVGMVVQCKHYSKNKEQDNHPYKRYRN